MKDGGRETVLKGGLNSPGPKMPCSRSFTKSTAPSCLRTRCSVIKRSTETRDTKELCPRLGLRVVRSPQDARDSMGRSNKLYLPLAFLPMISQARKLRGSSIPYLCQGREPRISGTLRPKTCGGRLEDVGDEAENPECNDLGDHAPSRLPGHHPTSPNSRCQTQESAKILMRKSWSKG